MNKYELIFESLQEYLDNGEITLEEAEVLNDYAYDRYVEEATRLAKELHKLTRSNDYTASGDRYEKILNAAGKKVDKSNDPKKGYGRHGFMMTDSLGGGKINARIISDMSETQKKSLKNSYTRFNRKVRKPIQKEVFNTEPADSSYYDAKRKASQRREILNDVGLQRGRALIKDQADKYKKQLDSTKNPLKKAMYNIDNKKAREAIAKEYITNKKETDREANDKLKEILKNRK